MTHRPRRYYRRRMTTGQKAAAAVAVAVALSVAGHHGHSGHSTPGTAAPASSNVALGQHMAATGYGWTGIQWRCLDWLWTRESRWSATAENSRSGAYGIAQALGHGPTGQYPAGPANPPQSDPGAQIRWGLRYIAATYRTPCGAWAHEQADGWY